MNVSASRLLLQRKSLISYLSPILLLLLLSIIIIFHTTRKITHTVKFEKFTWNKKGKLYYETEVVFLFLIFGVQGEEKHHT